ncbi:MAG TPA: M56 family metallopeptidase [Clostridia bacterium]|nr:M56 family metallopeptidase [Clostridia bacterium]
MTQWMSQLLWCSVAMTLLTGLFYLATGLLRRRYAAKWFYLAGIILLIGFAVPIRMQVKVSPERLPPFMPNAAHQPAMEQQSVQVPVQAPVRTSAETSGDMAVRAPAQPAITHWHIAFLIWLAGACGTLLYQGIRHVRFLRTVKRWSVPVEDAESRAQFERAKGMLALERHTVEWMRCACISSPMLIRLTKPAILMPEYEMSSEDLHFMLLHELIHYKRGDLWGKALTLLATAMHWFNPAVYFLARLVTLYCEISCDEKVVENGELEEKHRYAMSILGVVRHPAKSDTLLSTAFYGEKNMMKMRIASILASPHKGIGRLFLIGALVLTFAAGTAFAVDARMDQQGVARRYYPVGESFEEGVVDPFTMTCYGRTIYGIYDTSKRSWKLNTAYTSFMEKGPMRPPPANAVCLITVYDGTRIIGYEEISYEAFMISLPTRLGGTVAFAETYGRYKEYGFDHYSYDGRNVRGFWDEHEKISLVNIDPVTGGLFEKVNNYGVYIVAEYTDGALIGIKEITADEFSSIPGIIERVEAIKEQYFK